jgi:hypothetical protein
MEHPKQYLGPPEMIEQPTEFCSPLLDKDQIPAIKTEQVAKPAPLEATR